MGLFQRLFSHVKAETPATNGIPVGQSFPHQRNINQPYIAVLLSLTCADCIKLFPDVVSIAKTTYGAIELHIIGSAKDVDDAISYFDISFPVYVVDSKEKLAAYQVYLTPYIYYIGTHGVVLQAAVVHTTEEVQQFIDSNPLTYSV
jgi:hypothetical protein